MSWLHDLVEKLRRSPTPPTTEDQPEPERDDDELTPERRKEIRLEEERRGRLGAW